MASAADTIMVMLSQRRLLVKQFQRTHPLAKPNRGFDLSFLIACFESEICNQFDSFTAIDFTFAVRDEHGTFISPNLIFTTKTDKIMWNIFTMWYGPFYLKCYLDDRAAFSVPVQRAITSAMKRNGNRTADRYIRKMQSNWNIRHPDIPMTFSFTDEDDIQNIHISYKIL